MTPRPGLRVSLKAELRPALIGRLRMADWIEMPEREFASEIKRIEQDPLFCKLFHGSTRIPSAIRRQRWPRSRMALSFGDIGDKSISLGERAQVEDIVSGRSGLISKIRRMGVEAFERCFLHSDEPMTPEEIARRTSVSVGDVRAIHDLLLEIGTRAEFESPQRHAHAMRAYSCLARVRSEEGTPRFEFFSPHWARGRYHIRYDLLEQWKRQGTLSADERRKLPRLLKRLETVNLRQNTMFRIIESLARLQADYLSSRRPDRRCPVSLRQFAHRLDLAPSTVSRALSGRSVILPWGKEVPLIHLVPGRRKVLREIMSRWLEEPERPTDSNLVGRLREEHGITVSRRTVNAVRNECVGSSRPGAPSGERREACGRSHTEGTGAGSACASGDDRPLPGAARPTSSRAPSPKRRSPAS